GACGRAGRSPGRLPPAASSRPPAAPGAARRRPPAPRRRWHPRPAPASRLGRPPAPAPPRSRGWSRASAPIVPPLPAIVLAPMAHNLTVDELLALLKDESLKPDSIAEEMECAGAPRPSVAQVQAAPA